MRISCFNWCGFASPKVKNQTFESYLTRFTPETATKDIPLSIRKQLLEHYQTQLKQQKASMDNVKVTGGGGLPPYMSENILANYEKCIATLQKSFTGSDPVFVTKPPESTPKNETRPKSNGGFIVESMHPKVDPHYYYLKLVSPEKFESSEQISITATVKDLEAWKKLDNVKVGSEFKNGQDWIVTGSVPANKFIELSELPFVVSLNLPTSVRPI